MASASGSMARELKVTQLHNYPQLLLVLVVVSLEHSVSYNDGESCPCYYVVPYYSYLMTCVKC